MENVVIKRMALLEQLKPSECNISFRTAMNSYIKLLGKISAQPHTTLCIQFLNRENNDKNNTFPLGKQICFAIVWGCTETLPERGSRAIVAIIHPVVLT